MNVAYMVAAMAVVAAAVMIYAFLIEPYRIQVTRVDVPVDDLPKELDGFSICHLSDLHLSKFGRLERRLRDLLGRTNADIVVITGDMINVDDGLDVLREVLSLARPRLGIFAVPGNREHLLPAGIEEIAARLGKLNIDIFLNGHTTILSNGTILSIIGVSDPFLGYDDLDVAMSGVPEDSVMLLLAHSPDILARLGSRHIDLILAGHTHGGQIRMPFFGALWLHCRHRLGISSGYLSSEELSAILGRDTDAQMYVSRGLSSSMVKVRFLCPPELAIITLRRRFEK